MRTRAIIGTISAATLAAVLSGCSFIQSLEIQEFQPGQCLDTSGTVEQEEGEADYFPVVECTEDHDAEVYAVLDSTATEFDETTLSDEANVACYNAFEAYVGTPYEDSELYYSYIYPSSNTWDEDDRQIACLLIATGYNESLKGSGL